MGAWWEYISFFYTTVKVFYASKFDKKIERKRQRNRNGRISIISLIYSDRGRETVRGREREGKKTNCDNVSILYTFHNI